MKKKIIGCLSVLAILLLSACGINSEPIKDTNATIDEIKDEAVVSTQEEPDRNQETYIIQAEDTLSSIAEKFNTTVAFLLSVNDISDANHLKAGQVIYLVEGYAAPSSTVAPEAPPVETPPDPVHSAVDIDAILAKYASQSIFPEVGGFAFEAESWWNERIERTQWIIYISPAGPAEDEFFSRAFIPDESGMIVAELDTFFYNLGSQIMNDVAKNGDHVHSIHWRSDVFYNHVGENDRLIIQDRALSTLR